MNYSDVSAINQTLQAFEPNAPLSKGVVQGYVEEALERIVLAGVEEALCLLIFILDRIS